MISVDLWVSYHPPSAHKNEEWLPKTEAVHLLVVSSLLGAPKSEEGTLLVVVAGQECEDSEPSVMLQDREPEPSARFRSSKQEPSVSRLKSEMGASGLHLVLGLDNFARSAP